MCMHIFKYFTMKGLKHREMLTLIQQLHFTINILLYFVYHIFIHHCILIRMSIVVSHHFSCLKSHLNIPQCVPFSLSLLTLIYILSQINPKHTLFTSLKMIYPSIQEVMLKPHPGLFTHLNSWYFPGHMKITHKCLQVDNDIDADDRDRRRYHELFL